jgi:hypothetical protein
MWDDGLEESVILADASAPRRAVPRSGVPLMSEGKLHRHDVPAAALVFVA